jgi:hypothetical protein
MKVFWQEIAPGKWRKAPMPTITESSIIGLLKRPGDISTPKESMLVMNRFFEQAMNLGPVLSVFAGILVLVCVIKHMVTRQK